MIQIKNRWTLEVIFESKKETIKEAVEEAVENNADLRYADLSNADLSNANLRYADLSNANLRYADLRYANLRYADLRYADLRYADLKYADLSDTNLRSVNLSNANLSDTNLRCVGDMKYIKTMQIDRYKIGFTVDTLQIGCQRHSIEDWKNFDDEKINSMDSGALEWWNKWKDFIFKAIELSFEENKDV